ncbi:MAG: MarR family winged helix-turn-helix transcriptional regulator [Sphingomonadales bacterium]
MVQTARRSISMAGDESPMGQARSQYLDSMRLIERLHRRMLDVIKMELDLRSVSDINSVQALLLFNIGDNELTAGELRTRGYYLGSNVSYNLKKLVEGGYLEHQRATHDKRAVRIRVSEKGASICRLLGKVYDGHLGRLTGDAHLGAAGLKDMNESLISLERFWSDELRFAL